MNPTYHFSKSHEICKYLFGRINKCFTKEEWWEKKGNIEKSVLIAQNKKKKNNSQFSVFLNLGYAHSSLRNIELDDSKLRLILYAMF